MVVAPGNDRLKAIALTLASAAAKAQTVAALKRAKEELQQRIKAAGQGKAAGKYSGKTWAQELASIGTLVKDGKVYNAAGKMDLLPTYPREQWNQWRFTVLESPVHAPEGWVKPEFDDSHWDETFLPIVWPMAHTALLRTTFEVKDVNAYEALQVRANVYKQRNLLVYLNGQLVAKVNNMPGIIDFPLTPYAMTLLKSGKNSLAVSAEHGQRTVDVSFRLEARFADK
jgi:hypothetical protein